MSLKSSNLLMMQARLVLLLVFISYVQSLDLDFAIEDYENADVKCLKFSPGGSTLEKYYHDMLKTKPVDLPTVDWWFIIKQNGGWGFYYYDSEMDANNEESMLYFPRAEGKYSLDSFMLNHYRVLNGRNIRSTLKNGKIINMGHKENRNMDVGSVKLKSLGMWFNDQPSESVGLRGYPEDELKDSELKKKNYRWKFAHSKFMLALKVNEEKFSGGYMIDYSIPQSPFSQNFRQQEWIKEYPGMNGYSRLFGDGWEFFGDNGISKAQHLSCFNFDSNEVPSVLQQLSRTLPKPVLSTLSSGYFSKLLDANHATLVQNFFTPGNTLTSAKDCLDTWTRQRMLFSPWKLLGVTTPQCTQSMTIQTELIMLISHSPTPHAKTLPDNDNEVPQQKSSNSMDVDASTSEVKNTRRDGPKLREVFATFFGPIPWMTTANILKTPLYVATWTNVDLPTIVRNNVGVYLGDGLAVEGNRYDTEGSIDDDWERGQSHEKIGIALRKSDENKYWTCIADGNHRTSEISHAGATICISSQNLWTAVTRRLRREGGSYSDIGRVGQGEKNDAPLDITLSTKKTKYTPVFRWHISDSDPSKERKTGGVLGFADTTDTAEPSTGYPSVASSSRAGAPGSTNSRSRKRAPTYDHEEYRAKR